VPADEQKSAEANKPKPKKRYWCCIVPAVIVVLAVIGLIIYQFIPQDYSEKTPARNYQYPAPSAEAVNRQLTCDDFRQFSLNKDKYSPICLNLFKATADEINSANTGGKYNIILLYGQYSTFELYLPDKITGVDNIG